MGEAMSQLGNTDVNRQLKSKENKTLLETKVSLNTSKEMYNEMTKMKKHETCKTIK